ncbi:MAG: DUF1127 domain-containing protein [Aliishimia sp.]
MATFDVNLSSSSRRSGGLFAFAARAAEASRQRAALRRLDDAALFDLGLTRADAEAEASRPFWDVPDTWRA